MKQERESPHPIMFGALLMHEHEQEIGPMKHVQWDMSKKYIKCIVLIKNDCRQVLSRSFVQNHQTLAAKFDSVHFT